MRRVLGLFLVGLFLCMALPAGATAAPRGYISFIGDSTYSSITSISWVYKLHVRMDSSHITDSYYEGSGVPNRIVGRQWTFYNAAWGGKTLFQLYDGQDDHSGVWGQGSNLATTVISTFIPGTKHWVFIGGGLNDLRHVPTREYADRVLALRFQIADDVRAAGMIPIQCTLTPWGGNTVAPFSTNPYLAHDFVDYFNAALRLQCGTTTQVQDFYTPLVDRYRNSAYWPDASYSIGAKIHFTSAGKTIMANSVDTAVLGISTSLSISAPIAPVSVVAHRLFPVRGYLAQHIATGSPIRLYRWRLVSGHWKSYGSYGYVTMKITPYFGHSRYAGSISLPTKGTWRIRAYHPADSANGAQWSVSHDTVRVR